jgi:hypothetical protein
MRQKIEHIRGDDIDWGLRDDGEERLQIERRCAQRLRSSSSGDEGQIAIDERVTQRESRLTRRRDGTDKTRKGAHPPMLTAPRTLPEGPPTSPVY